MVPYSLRAPFRDGIAVFSLDCLPVKTDTRTERIHAGAC